MQLLKKKSELRGWSDDFIEQTKRNGKREQLAQLGFDYKSSSSASNNIDGWGMKGLENMERAYAEYGDAAIKAHNEGAIPSPSVAENYSQMANIVQRYVEEDEPADNSGSGNTGNNNSSTGNTGNNNSGTGGSSNQNNGGQGSQLPATTQPTTAGFLGDMSPETKKYLAIGGGAVAVLTTAVVVAKLS